MLSHEENDLLTRVSGDAPMGKLMRQHWTPVCLIEEVAEADGKPLLVEAIGNRYVAFRDSNGKLGLLDELCPHRRASLVFGRNEDSITAGSSMLKATVLPCRPNPKAVRYMRR